MAQALSSSHFLPQIHESRVSLHIRHVRKGRLPLGPTELLSMRHVSWCTKAGCDEGEELPWSQSEEPGQTGRCRSELCRSL